MQRTLNSRAGLKRWAGCTVRDAPNSGRSRGLLLRAHIRSLVLTASIAGTAVIQYKSIPRRPEEFDGRMVLFDNDGITTKPELTTKLRELGVMLLLRSPMLDLSHARSCT